GRESGISVATSKPIPPRPKPWRRGTAYVGPSSAPQFSARFPTGSDKFRSAQGEIEVVDTGKGDGSEDPPLRRPGSRLDRDRFCHPPTTAGLKPGTTVLVARRNSLRQDSRPEILRRARRRRAILRATAQRRASACSDL